MAKTSLVTFPCIAALCLMACTGTVTGAMDNNWGTMTVASAGNTGQYTSLAFDGSGRPCISYLDVSTGNLKYAWKSGGTWQIETVTSSGWYGGTSLAFDGSGNPCISYRCGELLQFARKSGGTWQIEDVDPTTGAGYQSSLAFDGSGQPCISYYNGVYWDLNYAWKSGGTWYTETVELESTGEYSSLAFNSTGTPCISYYLTAIPSLVFAYRSNGTWEREIADSGCNPGYDTCLVFDGEGNPCISYANLTDSSGYNLKYAYRSGGTWHSETVDSSGNVGQYNSLVLNRTGIPCISYSDWSSGGGLKYASKPDGTWENEGVDPAGSGGDFSSLAFDGSGFPCISYYTPGVGDLRYAFVASPSVKSINPVSGSRGAKVKLTVKGRYYLTNATVNLTKGASVINGVTKNVVVPGTIVATVKIPAKAKPGKWNLQVTNPDGRNGTKLKAFTVV